MARTNSRAGSRPAASCSTRIDVSRGKFNRPGSSKTVSASMLPSASSGGAGSITSRSPTGNVIGKAVGDVQPFDFKDSHEEMSFARSLLIRESSDATMTPARHRASALASSVVS